MNDNDQNHFNRLYEQHLNALTLQGKSKRTIEAYSRSLHKLVAKFDMPPDRITTEHLKCYFLELAESHSWSSVKIDRNAFQFFFKFVLNKQWEWFQIVRPPKVKPLQSVLAIHELAKIINTTRKLSEKNILQHQDGNVTFRYKNSQTNSWKTRTESAVKFLWLVLQHVLPKGFRRTRDYGFLHGNAKRLLGKIQRVLKVSLANLPPTNKKEHLCPCCHNEMNFTPFFKRPRFGFYRTS